MFIQIISVFVREEWNYFMLKFTQREKVQEQERCKEKREISYITCDLQQVMEAVRPENRQNSRIAILGAIPSAHKCLILWGRELTLCSPFHQHIHTHTFTLSNCFPGSTCTMDFVCSSVTCNCYIWTHKLFLSGHIYWIKIEMHLFDVMYCMCINGFPLSTPVSYLSDTWW